MKDLVTGVRKYVPMDRVVHIHVPAYESLKLEEIFSFFLQHEAVIPFMPEDKELRKMPKQWVCNVGATVIGVPFVDWVAARVKQRNEQVTQEKNMLISLDPAVAAAFAASTAVSRKYRCIAAIIFLTFLSVQNGVGVNMLKAGTKRRRSAAAVKAERDESKGKSAAIQQQLAELRQFEAQVKRRKEELDNGLNAERILSNLMKTGDVKQYEDGSWGAVQHNIDPEPQ